MKNLIRVLAAAVALTLATSGESRPAGPKPEKPKAAKKVNGVWMPVDEDNPATAEKSENALELYQLLKEGAADLQLDVTSWDPPAPRNLPEAIHALRYNTQAKHIRFTTPDVVAFGLQGTPDVEAAILALAHRKVTADKVALVDTNVVHYGLDKPETVEQAIAALVARIYQLETRMAAAEAAIDALTP